MRRRRQKNPLLMRIIVISVGVHIVALPLLAHFGAFKKIQEHFVQAQMVVLPPPTAPEQPKAEVKKQAAQKTMPTVKKGPAATAHTQQGPKSNLNTPHVAVAAGNGPGDGPGGDVAQGNLNAGQLPTPKADVTPPAPKDTPPPPTPDKPKPDTQTAKAPPPPVKDPPVQPIVKPAPQPEPIPAKPHEPVFTDAVALSQPQPTIPDELRGEALAKTFVAEFRVGMDGMPDEIKVAQSTGNRDLDRIALETAKRWRFKPATRDGQPIESRIRLHIEFQVN